MFGEKDNVTEVGTMNFFCLWVNEAGQQELRTPPLDGTILPGVTRDCIITLAKDFGIRVVEEKITMPQISLAAKEGRLQELFGCGTAAIVSPIKKASRLLLLISVRFATVMRISLFRSTRMMPHSKVSESVLIYT